MTESVFTYVAHNDQRGAFVPLQNRRRCVVVKYRNGKFAYICSAFGNMAAAEKRAAYLNEHHLSAITVRAEG